MIVKANCQRPAIVASFMAWRSRPPLRDDGLLRRLAQARSTALACRGALRSVGALRPWGIGEVDERGAIVQRGVEMQEPRADAGRALHVTGLGDERVGGDAIFRLHPAGAGAVARRARQQVG